MSLANPFAKPPRLPSPAKRSEHSRSPSRSPSRRHTHDLDPLLRDLSPSATLRAFLADPHDLGASDFTDPIRHLQTTSRSERALGVTAAQACLDVRSWTQEMEVWEWPGTFEFPEPARKKMRMSSLSYNTIATARSSDDEDYWGSLPAKMVQAYEQRMDEISQGLSDIDVEGLKDYVLFSHNGQDSAPASRDGTNDNSGGMANMRRLEDSTALITATILQTLPYLSRLNRLRNTWSVRLNILRNAPGYLHDLGKARTDLDHGWAAIAVSQVPTAKRESPGLSKNTMQEMRDTIEHEVTSLGRRLDRFLNELEGAEDIVPDAWIEDFEQLESAYGDWVVQADRRVLQNEWRETRGRDTQERTDEVPYPDPAVMMESQARDSQSITNGESRDIQSINPGTDRSSSLEKQRPRHIPIIIDYDGHGENYPASAEFSNNLISADQVARTRAAFLNDIERTKSLKQSKSPVRPFEHASNAFTRLFGKDQSPDKARKSRSRSNSSRFSRKSKRENHIATASPKSSAEMSSNHIERQAPSTEITTSSRSSISQNSRSGASRGQQYPRRDLAVFTGFGNDSDPALRTPKSDQISVATPTKRRPDVYRPTGLSSPFQSPKQDGFPENWPLASPSETSPHRRSPVYVVNVGDARQGSESSLEINAPAVPIESDVFDQAFIDDFGIDNQGRPASARASARPTEWTEARRRAASLPRKMHGSTLDLSTLQGTMKAHADADADAEYVVMPRRAPSVPDLKYNDTRRYIIDPDVASARIPIPPMPTHGALPTSRSASLSFVDSSNEELVPDSSRSNMSPSLRESQQRRISAPRFDLNLQQSRSNEEPDHETVQSMAENERPMTLKRASITSIESFPRSELKVYDVPRSSGRRTPSPFVSPINTPNSSRQPSVRSLRMDSDPHVVSPLSYDGVGIFPTPPRRQASLTASPASTRTGSLISRRRDTMSSIPLVEEPGASSPTDAAANNEDDALAPLNIAVPKQRNAARQYENPSSPTDSQWENSAPFDPRDIFDRHVNEVLQSLPGSIRFKSRSSAEFTHPRSMESRGYNAARPKATRLSARTGGLTIAPAERSPKKSSSASEPEVKLYHLTSAGSDEPIKLFVRLVGESERVMVRVGGGWADLADYLRQYAEHHGSRTVSEGSVEVQKLNGTRSRVVSGSMDPKTKTPVTPASARINTTTTNRDDDPDWLNQAQPVFNMGESTPTEQNISDHLTPIQNSASRAVSMSNPQPSTGDPYRPSSRQEIGEPSGGLAGPSSGKKNNLSEHKAKWVEGMLERAKTASAEKSKDDKEKYFGEIGKAGGTRRVVFRSSSAMGNKA